MGYRNAEAVYERWANLPSVPFRLLVFMALKAPDGPNARYYCGREAMMKALNVDGENGVQTVKRSLRKLRDEGALKVLESGRSGRNTTYLLCGLGGVETDPLTDEKGGVKTTPYEEIRGSLSDQLGGRSVTPQGGGKTTPLKKYKETKETQVVELVTKPTTSQILTDFARDHDPLPEQTMTALGQEIRKLQTQGIHPDTIRAGLDRWRAGRYPATALHHDVAAVIRERNTKPTKRASTTDQRVTQALQLAQRYDAQGETHDLTAIGA